MGINLKKLDRVVFWISLVGLLAIITNIGFSQTLISQPFLDGFYFLILGLGIITTVVRYLKNNLLRKRKVFIFDLLSICFTLWLCYLYLFVGVPFTTDLILENPIWLKIAVLFTFIREFSELRINFKRTILNPAQLFILSFLILIFAGSLLLLLPNATYSGISYLDALFTATSAVCVTGLIVVDTATHFTFFGQTIIMILIQLGGLGILTFASYFSFFFRGGTSYENQITLSDMTSSRKLSDVFSTLKYIILITFGIELFSAILIYSSIDAKAFGSQTEQLFFSVFHAISAFCNAGFSTLTNSMYETGYRFNYYLQLIIIATFVLGGLGFPIVVNLLRYLKYKISMLFSFSLDKRIIYKPWVLNLNSRITLVTTLTISSVAFVAFYILEYHHTLAEHSSFGKIVTSLFGATTPRTAGFNSIDTAAMTFPTLMMVFLLMWIGASPQSTGGGIKTSTFAIATLNILSLAKGKSRIEIFRREIADITVKRAFAIISLSLVVIGTAIMLISISDPEKMLMAIAFECFSAYSTVGLSLGITADLSSIGKMVIIFVMFVGRISMLSLVIAVFKKVKHKNYSYPKEEITIN
ncbi:potassium transporter TrkG [Arenibacter sp. GZD96]|uniref:TrkH family potassium uptake protein n=1 Tax=Aurantibrevibacter litoralis TaxID=3106030 RepID=UPI002B01D32D|nr:potassium transporter TrkG [Arenibacter sp. GZD-96]MEA1784970.1 potassium transporter TrkG [Arenibacter sp. GZD-96]